MPISQANFSGQSLKPISQANLSSQFLKPISQANFSSHFNNGKLFYFSIGRQLITFDFANTITFHDNESMLHLGKTIGPTFAGWIVAVEIAHSFDVSELWTLRRMALAALPKEFVLNLVVVPQYCSNAEAHT
jgi:hypothetical protein